MYEIRDMVFVNKIIAKKGETGLTFIAILILIVVSIILSSFFIAKFRESAEVRGPIEQCHAAFTSKSLVFVGESPVEELNLFRELVTENIVLSCQTTQKIINSNDPERIKRDIAEEMVKCWYKLGEGKSELFKVAPTQEETNFCVVCSEIEFSENIEPNEITGFGRFLFEKNVLFGPAQARHTGDTYFKYFTDINDDNLRNLPAPDFSTDANMALSTEKNYLAMAVISKEGFLSGLEDVLGIGGIASGAGAIMILVPGLGTGIGALIGSTGAVAIGSALAAGAHTYSPSDMTVVLVENTPEELERWKCDVLPTGQDLRGAQ